MITQIGPMPQALGSPQLLFGVTGHRATNPSFQANSAAIAQALGSLFDTIERLAGEAGIGPGQMRLHSLLVDGVDQRAAELALRREWQVVAPLPFGVDLNRAINSRPTDVQDAELVLNGRTARDRATAARAQAIDAVTASAHLFQLADRDDELRDLFVEALHHPGDLERQRAFEAACSDSVALAGQLMIERVDLMIGVWDRKSSNLRGGTGHTIVRALELGTPVLLIDPFAPERLSVCTRLEELGQPPMPDEARLRAMVDAAIPRLPDALQAIKSERWHKGSSRVFGLYRWIESTFSTSERMAAGSANRYEKPDEIESGSAAPLLAAASAVLRDDRHMAEQLRVILLPNFALADGVSTWLSDAYRSGMCYNFLFSMLAVIIGIAYLPLGLADAKWVFASIELLLLILIVLITFVGMRLGWHRRWFETRRVAEYLRHAPGMLLLGVSRHSGHWPQDTRQQWPEQFVQHCLREVGLPRTRIDRDYIHAVLAGVVAPHVTSQRDYHRAKAARLASVHRRLDRLAQTCFILAIVSVSGYLALAGAAAVGMLATDLPELTAKVFTFLGVALPTLGAGIAGIKYFGDFERFAAISGVTTGKLDEIATRIALLLSSNSDNLTYAAAASLVRAVDHAVVEEIASWQAVFGPKHITLPA